MSFLVPGIFCVGCGDGVVASVLCSAVDCSSGGWLFCWSCFASIAKVGAIVCYWYRGRGSVVCRCPGAGNVGSFLNFVGYVVVVERGLCAQGGVMMCS